MARLIAVGNKILDKDQIISVRRDRDANHRDYVIVLHSKDLSTRFDFSSAQEADTFIADLAARVGANE